MGLQISLVRGLIRLSPFSIVENVSGSVSIANLWSNSFKELYITTDGSASTELLDNLELVQTFTDIEQVSVSLEIIHKAIA